MSSNADVLLLCLILLSHIRIFKLVTLCLFSLSFSSFLGSTINILHLYQLEMLPFFLLMIHLSYDYFVGLMGIDFRD